MKFLRSAIVVSLCMLAIVSCKKNDSTPAGQGALIGKWQGQKIHAIESLNGQKVLDSMYQIKSPDYFYLDFHADSTLIISMHLSIFDDDSTTDTTYYLVKQGKLILTDSLQDTNGYEQADYQISGNQLLLHEVQIDTVQNNVINSDITFYLQRM